MATSKEKRAFIVGFAKTFDKGKTNYILEEGNNAGNTLITFLKYGKSGWMPGQPWCAAFISALAGYTDSKLSGIPYSRYNSRGSTCGGAGMYGGNNIKNAKPGLVIRWGDSSGKTGHVGLVVDVSSSGITTIEGNTGKDTSGGQVREGVETKLKHYSWDKAQSPYHGRNFIGYIKIWDEDDASLGTPLSNTNAYSGGNVVGSSDSSDSSESSGASTNSNSDSSSNYVQKDLSALFIDMSGIGAELNNSPSDSKKPEKEIKKSGTSSGGDVGTKTIINANIDFKETPTKQN